MTTGLERIEANDSLLPCNVLHILMDMFVFAAASAGSDLWTQILNKAMHNWN